MRIVDRRVLCVPAYQTRDTKAVTMTPFSSSATSSSSSLQPPYPKVLLLFLINSLLLQASSLIQQGGGAHCDFRSSLKSPFIQHPASSSTTTTTTTVLTIAATSDSSSGQATAATATTENSMKQHPPPPSPTPRHVKVLGVCGGIGSGKSAACKMLVSEFGCIAHVGMCTHRIIASYRREIKNGQDVDFKARVVNHERERNELN
jgi:hypothetical protein